VGLNEVVIAGIGQTPVGEHWSVSLRDLALQAINAARQDASGIWPDLLVLGNMLSPAVSHQAQAAALIADYSGLRGIEAVTVEAAGATGGVALRMGWLAVASGEVDVCLVLGVEKVTDQSAAEAEQAFAASMDADYEAVEGLTLTAQAALLMQRYLNACGAPREAFGAFPITAHFNGANNPNAMFRNRVREEVYRGAGMVSEPLNLFDVAPYADGAAAVVLTRPELLPAGSTQPLVRVAGSAMATDTLALHDRPDPLDFTAARLSVEKACRLAGCTPRDVDLFELHDAFSIYAALSLEAAGLAEKGQGWRLAQDGGIQIGGAIPISSMGGLKARGNPGGAAGLYQAVEAVIQLRGAAGQNQVPNARRALIQSLGGPASTAAAHVLERV
jgi:acetyl-CoA C-acetyltransferase